MHCVLCGHVRNTNASHNGIAKIHEWWMISYMISCLKCAKIVTRTRESWNWLYGFFTKEDKADIRTKPVIFVVWFFSVSACFYVLHKGASEVCHRSKIPCTMHWLHRYYLWNQLCSYCTVVCSVFDRAKWFLHVWTTMFAGGCEVTARECFSAETLHSW